MFSSKRESTRERCDILHLCTAHVLSTVWGSLYIVCFVRLDAFHVFHIVYFLFVVATCRLKYDL
jgi:hypothetical protein